MNAEKGYHFFANLTWRNWSVTAAFANHDIVQPISWGNTIFNDRGTNVNDQRNFIEAAYERVIGGDYPLTDGHGIEDNHQDLYGNWVGSQITYRFRTSPAGDFTVGAEGSLDLRNLMTDADVSPAPFQYLSTSNPNRSLAFIAQDEKKLSKRWKVDLGLRLDKSRFGHTFVSPRGALLYQRSEWTYKFLYGRGFRDPSTFQLFYSDGLSSVGNPTLRPESADTVEVDAERKLGTRMNLQASIDRIPHTRRSAVVGARFLFEQRPEL